MPLALLCKRGIVRETSEAADTAEVRGERPSLVDPSGGARYSAVDK